MELSFYILEVMKLGPQILALDHTQDQHTFLAVVHLADHKVLEIFVHQRCPLSTVVLTFQVNRENHQQLIHVANQLIFKFQFSVEFIQVQHHLHKKDRVIQMYRTP